MKPWLGSCSQLKVHSQWEILLLFSSHKYLLFIVSWRHTSSKCKLNLIPRSPPSFLLLAGRKSGYAISHEHNKIDKIKAEVSHDYFSMLDVTYNGHPLLARRMW